MNALHQSHLIKRDVMADDRTEVLELEVRYSAAINASDVDEIEDLFADDSILMLPDRLAVTGRDVIVAHQREFSRSIKASIKSVVVEVEVLESIVYVRGAFNYGIGPKMGGDTVVMRGKYLNLYKCDVMKQWRIWRSIYNIDHPHED